MRVQKPFLSTEFQRHVVTRAGFGLSSPQITFIWLRITSWLLLICMINYWSQSTTRSMKPKWFDRYLFPFLTHAGNHKHTFCASTAINNKSSFLYYICVYIYISIRYLGIWQCLKQTLTTICITQICFYSSGVTHVRIAEENCPFRVSVLQQVLGNTNTNSGVFISAGYSLTVQCMVLHYRSSWNQNQNDDILANPSRWHGFIQRLCRF